MPPRSDGPSSDAWGVTLTAPLLVSHQGLLLAFAREVGKPTSVLYFQALDPQDSMTSADETAWNGWYRYSFPEAPPVQPVGTRWEGQQPAPQLRLAGMDLLTVTPTATKVTPADASFQIVSDGQYLVCLRPSARGTLYLNRLVLQKWDETVRGTEQARFALESAWEVRYQRSGLRDIPLDATDTQSYVDLTGAPFLEPTLELSHVTGAATGAFAVTRVPTADPTTVRWYVACGAAAGVQLSTFTETGKSVADFTEPATGYPKLLPTLGGKQLPPLAGLAPALTLYAEQDAVPAASGESVEVQRAGRLLLAFAVNASAVGSGLDVATAAFDFGLDPTGLAPVLPPDKQGVQLVDGTVDGGVFKPDLTSPFYPTPAQALEVTHVVDGQVVTALLLGQVQPHTDPFARMAEDGLMHLYYGGPNATQQDAVPGWRALVPGQPQALVAQFDPRVSRLVIPVPWKYAATTEHPPGAAQFVARQSGPIMTGSKVSVSGTTFGTQPQQDLCDVTVTYPSALGFGTESWRGVPREVPEFAAVLNGDASDDSADPAVLTGSKPFYDFPGRRALARMPLTPPAPPLVGFAPALTLVSNRVGVPLAEASVNSAGGKLRLTLAFLPKDGQKITQVWPGLPAAAQDWADILAGSADTETYSYVAGDGSTPLFGLQTDAYQVDAPILLRPTGAGPDLSGLKIEVTAAAGATVNVAFHEAGPGFTVSAVPTAVEKFAQTLSGNRDFAALGLVVDTEGVGGNVLPTLGQVGAVDLRGGCALFDLVPPAADIVGWSVPEGSHTAGVLGHIPASGPDVDITRLAGFVCAPDAPDAGIPAYVQDKIGDLTHHTVSRTVRGATAAAQAQSGAWMRETPPLSCSLDGSNAVSVPVVAGPAVLPSSLSLRPQMEWTFEAWVQPSTSLARRLITFHDGVTQLPATAPQLDYWINLQGQDVVSFSSYAKKPGTPDSSFFQTGTSAKAGFLLPAAFTWEFWVQPQAQPTPAGALGGILQVIAPGRGPEAFSVTLTGDRHLLIRVGHEDGTPPQDLTSTATLAATTSAGLPTWTHVAIVGRQTGTGGPFTIELFLNAVRDSTFRDVKLQYEKTGAYLVIGRNTPEDASLFGKLCALRLWSTARTMAEIRRTAFMGLLGSEAGLLGCWPLTHIDSGGPAGAYVKNIANISGTDWNADRNKFNQDVGTVDDDYFLSLVASVAGLPAVEAHTVLPTDRWNHLAVIFTGGGALALNPASRFEAGAFDWMQIPVGDALNPGFEFAIDAWVQFPVAPTQDATIISHWAWEQSPKDRSYSLAIDQGGNLVLKVAMYDDQGNVTTDSVTSAGINLADGKVRHVAAVFTGQMASNQAGSKATYKMTLYADKTQIGSKNGTAQTTTVQLVTTQVPVLVGRTAVAPAGAEQAVESLGLYQGVLGRLRFWSATPALDDLFPEKTGIRPQFGPPAGLAAEWNFREQDGVLANDSVGSSDGVLTSTAPWSTLRETSTLAFVANGAPVVSVLPAADLPAATASQFRLGAPAEPGVPGLIGEIGQVSLWGVARTLEAIRDQQFTPRVGDEAGLLACWNFTGRGVDLTGGGNDANPLVDPGRIRPADEPVTSEGALVRNVYGGVITDYSACTVGRLAVGSFVDASGAGTRQARAVLKRQFVLDPNEAFIRPIEVGLLRLVYVGQVQTQPTLIGYIEGPPPVPSENLSRPYYLSQTGAAYTAYNGTASVTLTQTNSKKIAYSSSTTSVTDVDFKAALGIFGINYAEDWQILLMNTSKYSLKATVQAVASAKATFGDTTGQDLSGEWTSVQKDTVALKGDWEPYQKDPGRYLNPQVGRRFQPANLGYALVESLTADMYAMIFQSTGAAVGTIILPNFAIPPDRNLLMFPINDQYTQNGTLDGKVGLVNSPSWKGADVRRGSYFRPTEAYAMAASIEAENQRRQAYAAQFDWKGRGQRGEADLSDVAPALPVDFSSSDGTGAVPQTGIVNRYVWSANRGLHVEQQGFASVSSRTYTGWRNQGGGGGLKVSGEFFFYLGFAYSLDLLVTKMVDVHVGLKEDTSENIGLDVTLDVEGYLPAWDPAAPSPYGGQGAFTPGLCPGKVQQYRFMTFMLPPSPANARSFTAIVDPVWRQLSNDPTARAIRELDATNPVWRVLHRVTYVERVPPPIASRPVFSAGDGLMEPVNLEGNAELLRLITARIHVLRPTPAQVGAAVAEVINPAPTSPGTYPASVLEQSVPWWRTFLDSARPGTGGVTPNPAAAALLTTLFTRVIEYVVAGYRTGIITRSD
jgi:hypothetical protein